MKIIFITIICLFSLVTKADTISIEKYAVKPFGDILFLRHALAPGYGDPNNFKFNECNSQRNLNSEGRKQAYSLGKLLKQKGIQFDRIFSSQWCRCLETARLLELGPVTPDFGLNSFYQDIVSKEDALFSLKKLLIKLKKNKKSALMVTHYVTISAITGYAVDSGEAIAYDIESGLSKRILY